MSTQRPCKPRRPSYKGHLWDAVTRNILRVGSLAAEHLSPAAEDHSRVEADHSLAGVGPLPVEGVLLRAEADPLPVGVARSLAVGDHLRVEGGPSIAHENRQRRWQ